MFCIFLVLGPFFILLLCSVTQVLIIQTVGKDMHLIVFVQDSSAKASENGIIIVLPWFPNPTTNYAASKTSPIHSCIRPPNVFLLKSQLRSGTDWFNHWIWYN